MHSDFCHMRLLSMIKQCVNQEYVLMIEFLPIVFVKNDEKDGLSKPSDRERRNLIQ